MYTNMKYFDPRPMKLDEQIVTPVAIICDFVSYEAGPSGRAV